MATLLLNCILEDCLYFLYCICTYSGGGMSGAYCVKGRACTNALGNDLAAIEEGKKIAMQFFKTYLSIFLCLLGFVTDRTGATNLAMWKKWCEEDGTINNKKGKQTAKRESVSNSEVTSSFNHSSYSVKSEIFTVI